MGLAASQTRFLSLTARKSDLEYQAQMINTRRLQLSEASAAASKAYTAGMSNKIIKVDPQGKDKWEKLTYQNLQESGFQIIGANGTHLEPSPYTEYLSGSAITKDVYDSLSESEKVLCSKNNDGTYTVNQLIRKEATANFNGMDIQTTLVSGKGQIVTEAFFNYLCAHGYGTGEYNDGNGNTVSYTELLDAWNANKDNCNAAKVPSVVDWRADVTSTFEEVNYTEDDAQVLAEYEAATADIQAQDKRLEMELKNIETAHKAIETEMESVKKVIDKNIENSYKSFA